MFFDSDKDFFNSLLLKTLFFEVLSISFESNLIVLKLLLFIIFKFVFSLFSSYLILLILKVLELFSINFLSILFPDSFLFKSFSKLNSLLLLNSDIKVSLFLLP